MKRLLALILALVMVFVLVACGNSGDDKTDDQGTTNQGSDATPPADDGDDTTPPADGDGDSNDTTGLTVADGMGFYNPDYDYSQNPTYKVVGMFASVTAMYQGHIDMYKIWAELSNCEYTTYDSNGDTDAFLTAIETYAAQGVDGIINQCDNTIMARVSEALAENGLNYMSGFSPNVDFDNNWVHPYVGVDNYGWGTQFVDWFVDYANTNWSDWDTTNTKMCYLDYSVSDTLHIRGIGMYDRWFELYPDAPEDSFLVMDCVSEGGFTEEAGYNLVAASFARFPDTKYWLIGSCVEGPALGGASAAENYDKVENTALLAGGIDALQKQWDSGVQTAFRGGTALPTSTYSDPFWFGLYAMMSGQATPETIWPEYQSEDCQGYAYLPIYSPIMTYDEYQNYFAWSDAMYGWTGTDMAVYPDYKWDGVTDYPVAQSAGERPLMPADIANDPISQA